MNSISILRIRQLVGMAPVLFVLILGFAGVAFAHDYKGEVAPSCMMLCKPLPCLPDGFYGGISLGYDSYRLKQSAGLSSIDGSVFSLNPGLSATGWHGNTFLGYGQTYRWFYMAGEVVAMGSNADTSYTFGASAARYRTQVNARYGLNVAILPGMKLSPSQLIYTRIGYARTLFKESEQGINFNGQFDLTETHWENGIQLGLGMEFLISGPMSLRSEYHYIRYGSIKTRRGTGFSIANHQMLLSLLYHFT